MSTESKERVTQILRAGSEDENAWSQLLPLIYDELHAIARKRMSGERPDHTLQATALVNEAYMRLVSDQEMDWKSRRHFFGAAAEAMRRILIDHARKVRSQKRGGDRARVTLSVAGLVDDTDPDNILALGTGPAVERLISAGEDGTKFRVRGILAESPDDLGGELLGCPILGTLDDHGACYATSTGRGGAIERPRVRLHSDACFPETMRPHDGCATAHGCRPNA